MADVKIVDIDNVQWNMKDQEARNKVAALEESLSIKDVNEIAITLKEGYKATEAAILSISKYGKLNIGVLAITNLTGNNIGTTITTPIGSINRNIRNNVSAVFIEYISQKPVRISIQKDGTVIMSESGGITQDSNAIRGQLIWLDE